MVATDFTRICTYDIFHGNSKPAAYESWEFTGIICDEMERKILMSTNDMAQHPISRRKPVGRLFVSINLMKKTVI